MGRTPDGEDEAVFLAPGADTLRIERARHGYWLVGSGSIWWRRTWDEVEALRESVARPGGVPSPLPALAAQPAAPMNTIVYGPVQSRRLGRSLGINLSPGACRACSFDCVYCEFGDRSARTRGSQWPSPGDVGTALGNALFTAGPLDSITISGVGEPTLHPRFAGVVAAILAGARRERPNVPLRILTSGAGALRPEVRRGLDLLDERFVKLDAAADRIDRPSTATPVRDILAAVGLLEDVSIQACFVDGSESNVDADSVAGWIDQVAPLRPRRVHLYTIDQAPSLPGVRPARAERLEEIAAQLRDRTDIAAEVFA